MNKVVNFNGKKTNMGILIKFVKSERFRRRIQIPVSPIMKPIFLCLEKLCGFVL